MSSKVSRKDNSEVHELDHTEDNQGYDLYLDLDPATMTHRQTENEVLSGPNFKPRKPVQQPATNELGSQVGSDKILQLVEKIATLKTIISVLICVIVVYDILLLVLCLINFGVIGGLTEEDQVDDTPPVATCPADISNEIGLNVGGINVPFTEATATDNSGVVQLESRSHSPNDFFPVGQTTVTYVFEDQAGNRGSCSFTIVIIEALGEQVHTDQSTNSTSTSGAVYVRWGRTTCPSVSEIVYAVPRKDDSEVHELDHTGDNKGYDFLDLDPTTMTHRQIDNEVLSGPNFKPRTPMQGPDIHESGSQVEQTVSDKIQQLIEKNASLKTVNSVLIFVSVVYGTLLLIICIVVFGEIGVFKGDNKVPGLQEPTDSPRNMTSTSGAVYVRWGRTTCPSESEIVYAGIAGGISRLALTSLSSGGGGGGGSNYLCLPEDPEYDVYQEGVNVLYGNSRGYVFLAEYETQDFQPYADKDQHDVQCAVCRTTNRSSVMMIPAKMTCPSDWTTEYHGYLMSMHGFGPNTEFVCVDRYPEVVPGSVADDYGALFYPVEGICDRYSNAGNLTCNSYINGAELTCVVCSK